MKKMPGRIKACFDELGGYTVGESRSAREDIISIAEDYKMRHLKIMRALSPSDIQKSGCFGALNEDLVVTLKRDGMFNILYYDDSDKPYSIFCNSAYGRARVNLPVNKEIEHRMTSFEFSDQLDELMSHLMDFGKEAVFEKARTIHSMVLAGELYALEIPRDDRPRIDDVLLLSLHPKSLADLNRINFDIFDVISMNGINLLNISYEKRLAILKAIFPKEMEDNYPIKSRVIWHNTKVKPKDIPRIFDYWINQQGHEGLVVHTRYGLKYKIKPEQEIDALIIGFAELSTQLPHSDSKAVGSLLVALMRKDGTYQKLTSIDSGLTNEQREEYHELLKGDIVHSYYTTFNEAGQKFQFVRPRYIVEVKFNDLMIKSSTGNDIKKWVLKYEDEKWKKVAKEPFADIKNPCFRRMRSIIDPAQFPSINQADPKKVRYEDISVEQILELM